MLPILCYAYSPRKYAISEQSIVVKRLIGDVRIPLDNVREVRAATPDDFQGCVRLRSVWRRQNGTSRPPLADSKR